ncbi:glycosyltransferase family 4 protein [Sandaracinobacteroides saxicola]|uniref:Glycosyltransferase family 1 protein n=1 Tax=Sandaracinobacteroides saxicola TaxID=2759707 RepID=A0A7G5IDP0_9SPHN|nr:glycosyltransferase family 1 protein [Sandaracinobacteroides saxicola]QMW21482.1 glycosyltransferase family 1 protein [Sandaracinobacteroides saxicola]
MSFPVERLRVALFSGNYNYVRDGANQALNRLVGRIEARGGTVRVYSPTSSTPAFPPTGTLVSVPSFPFPGRGEYRVAMGLPAGPRGDLDAFAPNVVHLSAPDWLGHAAKDWAANRNILTVASVHTRFETYFDYYGLGFIRRRVERILRRFYGDLPEIFAPSDGMAELLRAQGWSRHVGIWSRGVDGTRFDPARRDLAWRRELGIADADIVVGFVGRLVKEKGLDVVADAAALLRRRGVAHRLLVVGEGPARDWIEERLPDAIFTGFLGGDDLGRAYASMDLMFNPSVTETFGNVTLEAMASGLPVVAARATGSSSLVKDGVTGRLVAPHDVDGFADAIAMLIANPAMRAAAGRAGQAASRAFDWDRINDAVIDRYCFHLAA